MHGRVFKKRIQVPKLPNYEKLKSKEVSGYHHGYPEGEFLSLDLQDLSSQSYKGWGSMTWGSHVAGKITETLTCLPLTNGSQRGAERWYRLASTCWYICMAIFLSNNE